MGAVSSIAPGAPFVDVLAAGLLKRWPDPLEMSRATVLLPTRRACRSLQEAFLRVSEGRALLLPKLLPLGDLDADELRLRGEEDFADAAAMEVPPAIAPLTRQLLLARLIGQWSRSAGVEAPAEEQAVLLAAELADLLDEVETEGLSFTALEALVPADYADHWQETLSFLRILSEHWPAVQAEIGCIGPAERRRRLHGRQAEAWRCNPPAAPIIAAGSTGSIPSTAELLSVIAELPCGEVILPGLDRDLDEEVWAQVAEDPTHPQHGMARLLARLSIDRHEVSDWQDTVIEAGLRERTRLMSMALLPAAASNRWSALAEATASDRAAAAFSGVRRFDCPGPGEEATVIALLLRQALETPGRTAALVTPDRALARRVAAELRRWDIAIDDSAGRPLADTPAGQFLRLTAMLLEADCAPLPLLACLKHPLAAGGRRPAVFRTLVRRLELAVLRGPRPRPGFVGLIDALGQVAMPEVERSEIRDWLRGLEEIARPASIALREGDDLSRVVAAHIAFAEALAADAEKVGGERLWAGDDGEAAANFVGELHEAVTMTGPSLKGGYAGLLDGLLAGRVVRPRWGRHPRLAILGPLEARLQRSDLLILGGLNEGTWPSETEPGPWLSRPMRGAFGLPPLERRIGLAAHDFAQALGAPEVVLTRATRVEGTPTVPSRWLLRLDALLQALEVPGMLDAESRTWLAWAAALDEAEELCALPPPAPTPPVEARPRRLSVTRVETWMRDPYALYAREILRLRKLEPLDADPSAADQGTLVHAALEAFVRAWPRELPEDPEAELLRIGAEVFTPLKAKPGVHGFWWPRYRRMVQWIVQQERQRRTDGVRLLAEVRGELPVDGLLLTAVADRIEVKADGSMAILDYKTGQPPSGREIALGFAPQLPLEAAMAAAGAFQGVPAMAPGELAFWRLSGGQPPGEEKPVGGRDVPPPAILAEEAMKGLRRLIARFADPATPYHAVPRPERALRYNDYAHLARIKEWSAGTQGVEE